MKIIFDKTGQTEQEWQEFRQNMKGIGGSDVAIIMGLSPFKTAYSLWLEKTGKVKKANLDNEFIEWGNLLEPVIRDKFRRETGFSVTECHYVLQHDQFEFMLANIDGTVCDNNKGELGILEIKTTSERHKKDWESGPPDYYMLQIQHYLGVTDYSYAYVAVLIGGNHFKYFKIYRDDFIIDKIILAEMEFWKMVQEKITPEIHPQDSESIAALFPEDNDETVLMPPEYEELVEQYWNIQATIKSLEYDLEAVKNKIKLFAGENKYVRGLRYKVVLPTITKKLFDSKRFAAEHPDVYEQYKTKESSYRGFTVKRVDEE